MALDRLAGVCWVLPEKVTWSGLRTSKTKTDDLLSTVKARVILKLPKMDEIEISTHVSMRRFNRPRSGLLSCYGFL